MRFNPRAFLAGILFFLALGTAEAQFIQYTTPGGPAERPRPRKEEVEDEIENARVHLGPVRVVPVFGVRDVAYQRSVRGEVETPSDVTATVEAGLQAYLRTGPKVVWRLQAVPEYVWWQDDEARRRLNGRYEAAAFGFFNRLTTEVLAGRTEAQGVAHPEVLRLVHTGQTFGRAYAEVELSGAFSAFATASLTEQDHLTEDESTDAELALEALDREERVIRAGLRWHRSNGLSIGLGAERSETEFTQAGLDRSNTGTAPTLQVILDRRRLYMDANLAARSLEARGGAAFVPYDDVTGNAVVTLMPRRGLGWSVYGSRNLVYSVLPAYAYLNDDRLGTSFQVQLDQGLVARLFGEAGQNDYTAFSAATPERTDDVVSYGAQLRWNLWDLLDLSMRAVRTEIDSNQSFLDRSYDSVGFTVSLARGL